MWKEVLPVFSNSGLVGSFLSSDSIFYLLAPAMATFLPLEQLVQRQLFLNRRHSSSTSAVHSRSSLRSFFIDHCSPGCPFYSVSALCPTLSLFFSRCKLHTNCWRPISSFADLSRGYRILIRTGYLKQCTNQSTTVEAASLCTGCICAKPSWKSSARDTQCVVVALLQQKHSVII